MSESRRERCETLETGREQVSFGTALARSPLQSLLMPDTALQTAECCSSVFPGFAFSPWRTPALKQRVLKLAEGEGNTDAVSQAVSRMIKKQDKLAISRTSARIFLRCLIGRQAFERGKN